MSDEQRCPVYWGSHGCDLPPGGHQTHRCGSREPCSEFEITDAAVSERIKKDDLDGLSDMADLPGHTRYCYAGSSDEWGDWHGDSIGFLTNDDRLVRGDLFNESDNRST